MTRYCNGNNTLTSSSDTVGPGPVMETTLTSSSDTVGPGPVMETTQSHLVLILYDQDLEWKQHTHI